jgi:hypothetical protein
MKHPREKNSELRLKRLVADPEPRADRGILELFHREQPDEDAPLARATDDDDGEQ